MSQNIMGVSLYPDVTKSPSDFEEPQYGLNATLEDSGDKQRLDDKALANIFATEWDRANSYRLRFLKDWRKAYLQYYGQVEDLGKAEWQSRVNVPLPYQAVNIAASRIVDSLFSNEDFFDIIPQLRTQDGTVQLAKNVIQWQLNKSDAREKIETSIKDALICGNGPMKVYFDQSFEERTVVEPKIIQKNPDSAFDTSAWFTPGMNPDMPQYEEVKEFVDRNFYTQGLRLDPILPTDIWLDPSGRGEYVIHHIKRNLSDLWVLSKDQKDQNGKVIIPAVYDADVVKQIRAGQEEPINEVEAAIIRRDVPYIVPPNDVDVYEFWGNIRDPKNGVLLYKNVVMTVVNKQFVIRKPQRNPFRHRMYPFVMFTCGVEPHNVYSMGILTQGSRLQDAIIRHSNILLDKQMLSAPMAEADPLAARNPEQLTGSNLAIGVGKILLRKNGEKPILYPMQGFPPVTSEDFQIIEYLKSEYQSSNGISEWATGQAQSTNRKTKEEVQARVQAVQGIFNSAAQHIEKSAMSPLLKMVYYLTLQFEPAYSDDTLAKMVAENREAQALLQSLRTMTPEERWEAMYLDAEFRCNGITLAITRADKLNRLAAFEKSLAADPYMGLLADKRALLREHLQLLGLPSDVMLPNADQLIAMIQQMQIQQLVQPPQQQPGQPGVQGTPGANQHNTQEALAAQAGQGQLAEQPPQ